MQSQANGAGEPTSTATKMCKEPVLEGLGKSYTIYILQKKKKKN